MIEVLKPYVYNLRANKVNLKSFPKELFPVLILIT